MYTSTLGLIIIGILLLFGMKENFDEHYTHFGSKKFRMSNLKNVKRVNKELTSEYKKAKCSIKPNPKGNVTHEINKGYDCRFYQTGILFNNNALKSWSN